MTKLKIGVLIISIFFILFAVSAVAATVNPVNKTSQGGVKAYPAEPVCKVSSCVPNGGKVLAKIYPSNDWSEVVAGQTLKAKDYIKTDACSNLNLQLPDNSTISIRPNTEISLEELVFTGVYRKLTVNVPVGELRTIVKKVGTPSEFTVKTPAAISGAKGTIFYLKVSPTSTSIYVADGLVTFFDPVTKMTYSILAGFVMTINLDGTIDGPKTLSDEDIASWTKCYTDLVAEPFTTPGTNSDPANPPNRITESPISG